MKQVCALITVIALMLAAIVASARTVAAATSWNLVAMGDSITSGEGTYGTYLSGTNTSSNMCHRSPNSYAAQFVGLSINSGSWHLNNVACSGAGTNELSYSANPNTGGIHDAGEQPQVNALQASPNLIVLTIGINDLNLAGFATQCYSQTSEGAEDNCFKAMPSNAAYQQNLSNLPGILDSAYQNIRNATSAPVAVLTYPDIYPSSTSGSCASYYSFLGIPILYAVTSQAMLNVVNGAYNKLNSTITTEANKYPGFFVVNEQGALAGHDICSGSPYVNNINNVNTSTGTSDDESLHPTVAGYKAMAQVLANRLDAGHFSNGFTDSAVQSAYTSYGGLAGFGLPTDNGGSPYVHYWSNAGANVEDFSGGSLGPAVIVDGPDGAFYVNQGFRNAYISGGWVNQCKAPVNNAYGWGSGTRQDFLGCSMTWSASTGRITFHVYTQDTTNSRIGFMDSGGRMYAAWSGTDSPSHLNLGWGTSLQTMSCGNVCNKVTLSDTSWPGTGPTLGAASVPGLSGFQTFVAWTGTNTNIYLGYYNGSSTLQCHTGLVETSHFSPYLIGTGSSVLYLVWAGTDSPSHVNIAKLDVSSCSSSGSVTQDWKTVINDTAAAGPAGIMFNGQPWIAWPGTDGSPGHIFTGEFTGGSNLANHTCLCQYTTYSDLGMDALSGTAIIYTGTNDVTYIDTSGDGVHYGQSSPGSTPGALGSDITDDGQSYYDSFVGISPSTSGAVSFENSFQ